MLFAFGVDLLAQAVYAYAQKSWDKSMLKEPVLQRMPSRLTKVSPSCPKVNLKIAVEGKDVFACQLKLAG